MHHSQSFFTKSTNTPNSVKPCSCASNPCNLISHRICKSIYITYRYKFQPYTYTGSEHRLHFRRTLSLRAVLTANKLHGFFLTTYNFAVVCTFSPRHIGYHLLFITKNVLTTKSHIPDTQKKEEIATSFGTGELFPGKHDASLPGCSELAWHTRGRAARASVRAQERCLRLPKSPSFVFTLQCIDILLLIISE